MKPSAFATICTQNSDAWKSDWDVYLNAETLNKLSMKCMVDEDLIKRSCFYYNCDYIYNQTEQTPQVKWVMPLGVRTSHKNYGLQYCPFCLIEDGDRPYFRRHWRLGFMTCCPFHQNQLRDRCPSCRNPINIKRPQKPTKRALYHPEDIAHCSKCGFDLRRTEYAPALPDEYEINRINFTQSSLGYGNAGNLDFNYSNLYFEGIRRLISFLVCSPKGEKLFLHLRNKLELHQVYHRELIGHNVEPERLEIGLRRTALIMIYYLLRDWPDTFVDACKMNRLTSHLIKTPYLEFPFWVIDALFFHLQHPKYSVHGEEKNNIIIYLERKLGQTIKPNQISRYLNHYFSSSTQITEEENLDENTNNNDLIT